MRDSLTLLRMFSQIFASLNLQKRFAKFAGPTAYAFAVAKAKNMAHFVRTYFPHQSSRNYNPTFFLLNRRRSPNPQMAISSYQHRKVLDTDTISSFFRYINSRA